MKMKSPTTITAETDPETTEEEQQPPLEKPRKQGPVPVEGDLVSSSNSASGSMAKKKNLFSKTFSDEDEIAILKGLAVFWAHGKNNNWTAFYSFIKDQLLHPYTKLQVSEKIRRLKEKFLKNFKKSEADNDSGRFDPHEALIFKLSKRLWGDDVFRKMGDAERPNKEKLNDGGKIGDEEPKKKLKVGDKIGDEKPMKKKLNDEGKIGNEEAAMKKTKLNDGDKIGNEEFKSSYPLLYASFEGYLQIFQEHCHLIGREKARELEQMWRRLREDELRLYLKRMHLVMKYMHPK